MSQPVMGLTLAKTQTVKKKNNDTTEVFAWNNQDACH